MTKYIKIDIGKATVKDIENTNVMIRLICLQMKNHKKGNRIFLHQYNQQFITSYQFLLVCITCFENL